MAASEESQRNSYLHPDDVSPTMNEGYSLSLKNRTGEHGHHSLGSSASDCITEKRSPEIGDQDCLTDSVRHKNEPRLYTGIGLLDLPNEILTLILAYLDNISPSSINIIDHPTPKWTSINSSVLTQTSSPTAPVTRSNSKLTLHQFTNPPPLKTIRLTCHHLSDLAAPLLFKHARLDIAELKAFIAFMRNDPVPPKSLTHVKSHAKGSERPNAIKSDASVSALPFLSQSIISLTIHLQGPQTHIHPPWWKQLLCAEPDILPNLKTLRVGCAPHVFNDLLSGINEVVSEMSYGKGTDSQGGAAADDGTRLPLDSAKEKKKEARIFTTDSWAFNMDYQYLELSFASDVGQDTHDISKEISGSSGCHESGNVESTPGSISGDQPLHETHHRTSTTPGDEQKPNHILNSASIFTARPWTSLTYNEGSNLAAYTRYEYFLKKPPSLLTALHSQLPQRSRVNAAPTSALPGLSFNFTDAAALPQMTVLTRFLSGLHHVRFVSIFPFYNNLDSSLLRLLRHMPALRTLQIKLRPDARNGLILADEMRQAGNHIDMNDVWSEWNTDYALLGYTVDWMGRNLALREVQLEDWETGDGTSEAEQLEGVQEFMDMIIGGNRIGAEVGSIEWRNCGRGLFRRESA